MILLALANLILAALVAVLLRDLRARRREADYWRARWREIDEAMRTVLREAAERDQNGETNPAHLRR